MRPKGRKAAIVSVTLIRGVAGTGAGERMVIAAV
jgi:hypothetical protein